MAGVISHTEDVSMSMDVFVEASPGHGDCCGDHTEREPTPQPSTNVSRDMCLILAGVKPQACPALPPSKFLADITSLEERFQVPASSSQVASSQQPSVESLMSLGIKVRDFAYENTLPAIVPVPRVPRQVQPTPPARKRTQKDRQDEDSQSVSEETRSKRPRYLERKATEPVQEPAVQHTRTLERLMVNGLCAIIAPPRPRTQLSASPPTSSLMPARSPAIPFVVRGDDARTVPAPQPLPLHPVLYTRFTLDSRPSTGCTPASTPLQNVSPPSPINSILELSSPIKESEANPLVRKCHGRVTADSATPSNRYQLRPRPSPSSRAPSLSRCSAHQAKSHPQRTRRVR